MSKVQVDKVVNLSDDGAPQLTYGAELPVGYGLTGAGGLNITGVVTAASAVFSGNVTIGGTLTYEDVTNIDALGIVTARAGVNVSGGELLVGSNIKLGNAGVVTATSFVGSGANLTGVASTDYIITGTAATFNNKVYVNSTLTASEGINVSAGVGTFAGNVSIADKIIHTGDTDTAIRFSGADTITAETGGSERLRIASDGDVTIDSSSNSMQPGAAINIISDKNVETGVDDMANYHLVLKNPQNDTGEAVGLAFGITDTAAKVGGAIIHERDGAGSYGSMKFFTRPDNSGPPVEHLRINSTGQTIVGDTIAQLSTSSERPFQVHSVNGPKIAIGRNDTSITDGNTIGGIEFYGNDANGTFVNTASIYVNADGTHGDNDKPTRMQFYTTEDGGSSQTERLRIDASGDIGINKTSPNMGSHSTALTISNVDSSARTAIEIEGNTANCHAAIDFRSNGTLVSAINSRGTDRLQFCTGSSGNVKAEVTGDNFKIEDGDLVIGTAGHGIDFSAQTASSATGASASAEVLDHYEEGTWTPTMSSGTVSGGATGRYVRIGDFVFIYVIMNSFSDTTSNTAIQVSGVPFACAGQATGSFYPRRMTMNGTPAGLCVMGSTSSTLLEPQQGSDGNNMGYHPKHSDFQQTAAYMNFSIGYRVT